MSDEIATTNGEHAMAYTGDVPWHRLGKRLDHAMTATEAMTEGGLDYEVAKVPMFAEAAPQPGLPDGIPRIEIPNKFLQVRTDDFRPLGIVSERYQTVQNRTAFDFLDSLAGEGRIRYDTVGALGDGERIWLLAKLDDTIRVNGTDDIVDQYLLLANSHDGTMRLRCFFTPIRVVCANTLTFALSDAGDRGVSIQHTGEIDQKVEESRKILGLAVEYFDKVRESADVLASSSPTDAQLDAYFRTLYPDPAKGSDVKAKATRMALYGLYEKGKGQDIKGVSRTWWAALNSVTEFVDHHTGTTPLARMESSWWGDGSQVKAIAFNLAIAAVKSPEAIDTEAGVIMTPKAVRKRARKVIPGQAR